jgi:trimeric autotransporter adhesin
VNTKNTSIARLLLAVALATAITGCGGGGGGGGSAPPPPPPTFTIGGTVTGLTGTLVLRNNGTDALTLSANSAFTFNTRVASGGAYSVTVQTHPSHPAQDCVITNGSGTASANVTNVTVVCGPLPVVNDLLADANVRSAKVSWTSPSGATGFNVYVSSARNCDIRNYTSCPDGALITNVTSPHTIPELRNGQAYFFQLETVYGNGSRGLSNEAGARPNALAFNSRIHAIAPAADGVSYLGGDFTTAGVLTGSAVPLDATSGRLARPDFPMVVGEVYAVAPDGAGGWYLGGDFTQVGDEPRGGLAHILADGAVDPDFTNDMDGAVYALAVSGSVLYVGGEFTEIGGQPRNNLAAIGADGDVLGWAPGAAGIVHALAVSSDVVYVGGDFSYIAAIDASGADVRSWDVSGSVYALAVSGSTVYAGGEFTEINNEPRNHLAAIDVDGDVLGWAPVADDFVLGLAVSGNTVYAAGAFDSVNAAPRGRLAAIGADGAVLDDWTPDANGGVSRLVVSGNTVYAGGNFSEIDGEPRNCLAAIGADGAVLDWAPDAGDEVLTLAASNGVIYAGGLFTSIDAERRRRLAAIAGDGTLLDWAPGASTRVYALAVSNNTVYAGGEFTQIDNQPRNRLAAFDTDGVLLNWNPGASAAVRALAVSQGGLYVGGDFAFVGEENAPRGRLAAFDAAGVLRNDWAPNANGSVYALAVSSDDTPVVYAGGLFLTVDGFSHNYLAAIDASGAVIHSWSPQADNGVRALAISGNTLYAGGAFTQIDDPTDDPASGTKPRSRLAAIDGASGEVLSWNPGAGDGAVLALAVSGSAIYAGGSFTTLGNEPRSRLGAIGANGALLPWDPDAGGNVFALAVNGEAVLVGGDFARLGGSERARFGSVTPAGEVVP